MFKDTTKSHICSLIVEQGNKPTKR